MDELEFRRRAITHPSDRDPAFLAAAEASVANRKHLDEMKQLDRSLQRAMEVVVLLGGPPLLAALAVGLVVSIFQAATQINEATLTFIPKLLVAFLVFVIAGPWML